MFYDYDDFYAPEMADELRHIGNAINNIDLNGTGAEYLYMLLGNRLTYLADIVEAAKKEGK